MCDWAKSPVRRDQMVLFPTHLDEVVGSGHPVRLLDEILSRLDWSQWESHYNLERGQPPIHPRILAGVLLYGLMKRIRSSRALEEALEVRLDFRWLAEGRSIDHSTLSKFRCQHPAELKKLFVQIGLVARQMSLLPLEQLAFDGTRLRANNRRSATRTPAEVRAWRAELAKKYAELEQRMAAADAQEETLASTAGSADLPQELADVAHRLAVLEDVIEELDRVEAEGETVPSRIPLTDPQSRVTPNKEGGFAPNYTPLATVDAQYGFIVAQDVLAMTDEEASLIPQLEQVQQDFGLEGLPPEVLADGVMCTGANLQGLQDRGCTLYSPSKLSDPTKNPAHRPDLTQPVPPDQWDLLPILETKGSADKNRKKHSQLAKDAFVYDAPRDCYWCPNGQPLEMARRSTETLKTGTQERRRYKSDPVKCAGCPLWERCLKPNGKIREVSRYEHDHLQEALAQRMSTAESQAKYARRRHVAERPFAMIKQHYGARRFLLRGLDKVRQEWRWLTTAFNLDRLLSLLRSRAGPVALGASSQSTATLGIIY